MANWEAIILTLLVLIRIILTQEHEDQRSIELNNKYFASLQEKLTPLYYCNPNVLSSILYRLPKTLNCDYLKLDKPSKVVPVTLWFDSPGLESTPAHLCQATTTFAYKDSFFFGGYAEKTTVEEKYVTEHQCQEMIKSKVSPDGDTLHQIAPTIWTTKNEITIDFKWPNYYEETIVNYMVSLISVTRSNSDDNVITSIPVTETCPFKKGVCRGLDKSVIIWDQKLSPNCRLTKGPSSLCLYSQSDDRLTCPELTISVTNTSRISLCNLLLFTSFQGIIYTTDLSGEIDDITATTSMVDRMIRLQAHDRRRREIPPFTGIELSADKMTARRMTITTTKTPLPISSNKTPENILLSQSNTLQNLEENKSKITTTTIPPFNLEFELAPRINPKPKVIPSSKTTTTTTPLPIIPDYDLSEEITITNPESIIPPFTGIELARKKEIEEQSIPNTGEIIRPIDTPPNNQPGLTHLPMMREPVQPLLRVPTFEEYISKHPRIYKKPEREELAPFLETRKPYSNRQPIQTHQPRRTTIQDKISEHLTYSGDGNDLLFAFSPEEARRKSVVFTSPEVNARLQYLFTIIQQNLTSQIQEVHHGTCVNQKMLLDLLITQAENRQAEFITRVLLPNERYLVQNQGDAIELKQCIPVLEYHFEPRNETECTRNIPVIFILENTTHKGYMNEMSHQIVDQPERIDCQHQKPFYFDTVDDGIILLANNTQPFNIPYLPTSDHFGKQFSPLKDQVFHTQGVFTTNQLTSQDTFLGLIQQMKKPSTIDNIIKASRSGTPLDAEQSYIAEALTRMTTSAPARILQNIGYLILATIVLIVLLKFLWYLRKFVWKCLSACCLACCRICKRRTPTQNPEVTYTEMQTITTGPPSYRTAVRRKQPKTVRDPTTNIPVTVLAIDETTPFYPDLEQMQATAPREDDIESDMRSVYRACSVDQLQTPQNFIEKHTTFQPKSAPTSPICLNCENPIPSHSTQFPSPNPASDSILRPYILTNLE
jgi:hypothetical protein